MTWKSGLRAQVGDRVATCDGWLGAVTGYREGDRLTIKLDVGGTHVYYRDQVRLVIPGALDPLPEDMTEEQYSDLMTNYD